jgi:hypothetical protein
LIPDLTRKGLSESLEAYAKRVGLSVRDARPFWRAQGLGILKPALTTPEWSNQTAALLVGLLRLCRIAPGVSIPTRTPTEKELYSYVDRY